MVAMDFQTIIAVSRLHSFDDSIASVVGGFLGYWRNLGRMHVKIEKWNAEKHGRMEWFECDDGWTKIKNLPRFME